MLRQRWEGTVLEDEPTPNQRRVYKLWFQGNGKIPLSEEDLAELKAEEELFERLCEKWEAEAFRETDTQLDWDCYMNVCLTNYLKKMDIGLGHAIYGRKGTPIPPELLAKLRQEFERDEGRRRERSRPARAKDDQDLS
jgi:hypothetical protein